jgi:hypothetical protein
MHGYDVSERQRTCGLLFGRRGLARDLSLTAQQIRKPCDCRRLHQHRHWQVGAVTIGDLVEEANRDQRVPA